MQMKAERFKVNHLVLLIGGNPLPNIVAAVFLAAEGARLTLLSTAGASGTEKVAEKIANWLKQAVDATFTIDHQKITHKSDPVEIQQRITSAITDHAAASGNATFGVHYTGGAKVMAVHSYLAAWVKSRNEHITCFFSYLDPSTLELVIDQGGAGEGEVVQKISLGYDFKISVADLMVLHGWRYREPQTYDTAVQIAIAEALVRLFRSGNGHRWVSWIEHRTGWFSTWNSKAHRGASKKEQRNHAISGLTFNLPVHKDLREIAGLLRQKVQDGVTVKEAADNLGFFDADDLCRWLHGSWLESIAMQAFVLNKVELGLHDIKMNNEIEPDRSSKMFFEIDVLAMRGYQLFAVSCSTSGSVGVLKKKLFELMVRARQIGGDEARIALVCCANNTSHVEEQLNQLLPHGNMVKVFGLNDLVTHALRIKFNQWINNY